MTEKQRAVLEALPRQADEWMAIEVLHGEAVCSIGAIHPNGQMERAYLRIRILPDGRMVRTARP